MAAFVVEIWWAKSTSPLVSAMYLVSGSVMGTISTVSMAGASPSNQRSSQARLQCQGERKRGLKGRCRCRRKSSPACSAGNTKVTAGNDLDHRKVACGGEAGA